MASAARHRFRNARSSPVSPNHFHPPESAVAAPALPSHSKTLRAVRTPPFHAPASWTAAALRRFSPDCREHAARRRERGILRRERAGLRRQRDILRRRKMILRRGRDVLRWRKMILRRERGILRRRKVILRRERAALFREKDS